MFVSHYEININHNSSRHLFGSTAFFCCLIQCCRENVCVEVWVLGQDIYIIKISHASIGHATGMIVSNFSASTVSKLYAIMLIVLSSNISLKDTQFPWGYGISSCDIYLQHLSRFIKTAPIDTHTPIVRFLSDLLDPLEMKIQHQPQSGVLRCSQ